MISASTDYDEYDYFEMFNVTFVDQTDYSEASYNCLLFPFIHPFKAPNIVAFEKNLTEAGTELKRDSWLSTFLGNLFSQSDEQTKRGYGSPEHREQFYLFPEVSLLIIQAI